MRAFFSTVERAPSSRTAAAPSGKPARRGNTGSLLVETSIALMVFLAVGASVLVGLSRVQSSGLSTENESVAENLARNQMESLFSLPYQDPPSLYPPVIAPAGYSVTGEAEEYVLGSTAIEKVVVRVSFGAKEVLTLETLRLRGS